MKNFRAARALGEVNQSAPDLDGPGQSLFFSRFSDHGPLHVLHGKDSKKPPKSLATRRARATVT